MTRVFNFLYNNEKSKKYIIFTLISVYCCLVLSQSLSIFFDGALLNIRFVINIIKVLILFIVTCYFCLDVFYGVNKINKYFFLFFFCFFISFIITKSALLLIILLFVYVLKQYKFEDFIKYSFWWITVFYFVVVTLSFLGVVPDIMGTRGDVQRRTLGFDAATVTQSIFMFIILMSAYVYKNRLHWIIIVLEAFFACVLYYLTDTRAEFYLSLLILLVVSLVKVYKLLSKNKKSCIKYSKITSFVKWAIILFPMALCVIFGLGVVLWSGHSSFIIKLDSLFSGRISLTYDAFINHGFPIFGKNIIWTTELGRYIGVDNSYYHNIFSFGIINAIIILLVNTFLIKTTIEKKNYWLTFCMIVMVIDAFVEPSLLSYQYNLFVFALVEMFDRGKLWYGIKNKTKEKEIKDMQNKKFTAVVVTYNRKELLTECIHALQNQTYKNLNILIVDNASTDGTEQHIKPLLNKTTTYVNTGANLGGAGGFNFGIKQAVLSGADYVWVMDDDCIPNKDALQNLIDYGEQVNGNFGFLSSKVLWKDNSICAMNVQRTSIGQEITDFDKPQKIVLASFVSIMLNVNAVEDVGLPIKDFFIWGDDWDYTKRLSDKFDCYYVPQSVVIHKSKNNMGVNIAKDESDRLDRYFYAYRNEGYFYSKQGFNGWLYFFIKKQLHKMRILFSKGKNKKQKFAIMKKGCKAVKNFNPQIEYVYRPETKINVLECFAEPLAYGGQEAFIINMYKNFTQNQLIYTFFTPFELTNQNLINLAKERNETILHDDKKFNSKLRKVHIKNSYKNLFANNNFDVVHIHSGSVWALLTIAKLAKIYGVKKVIVHSHLTGNKNIVYKLIKWYSDCCIKKYVDKFCACSNLAAEWKFPKDVIQNNNYIVVNNGIDIQKFTFDKAQREEYRKQFNLANSLVLCNVGRLSEMKNQMFSIDVAKQLKDKGIDFKFFLVGEGELKEQIVNKINKLELQDNFIMLEKRNDVAQIMMASDLFMFPSLFEGLGIVAIEAQSTGLPCIVSPFVPEEAQITDIIKTLPLDVNKWVEDIVKVKNEEVDRTKYSQIVADAGYNAKQSAQMLEQIYVGEKD